MVSEGENMGTRCAYDKDRPCNDGCVAYIFLDTPEGVRAHCMRMGKNITVKTT